MANDTETLNAEELLDLALIQVAAESYLHQSQAVPGGARDLFHVLRAGSNNLMSTLGKE